MFNRFIRVNVIKGVFYLFLVLLGYVAFGQNTEQYLENLGRLKMESADRHAQRAFRIQKYSEENSVPISFRDTKGNWVLMFDVTPWGDPVYVSTDNVGASFTIGANQLQQGGSLGIDITGENITVGVWDGGIVASHIEFEDRLISSEGSALDDHATHVTGTIASGGINNPNSRGMAPKAKIVAWDFNNDESEVLTLVRPDQATLLLSNHSYGLITGWRFNNGWQWFGNSSISTLEDHRFGFYSGRSRTWDEIMFNAPFYTMVKSAGNDRSDTGNGTIPADCNGGAGFDCLGDLAVCKNNIVVGAVAKQSNYSGPASVVMSSFSSWGPSDDGRIKPDLVAAGVSISSTLATGLNSYGVLSGTSMSTPSVTGGLALLQDLHKKLTGNYMRSATLKALAIHTIREAGPTPGPDYMFGWGLLDVERAAEVVLARDDKNIIINETVLANGHIYEIPLTPVQNEKITVTIAWTDPAGNPVAASLDPTNPMLINDLDVRIVDDSGDAQMPWRLSPQDVTKEAIKGDNVLDNVEKIEFDSPQARNYKIVVSHKGQLLNGQQAFSIIVTYKSLSNLGQTYYWVGGSGQWMDQSHWSLSSGGTSTGQIPTLNDRVFFDENSFPENSNTISVSTDIQVGSIAWFSNNPAKIDLNGSKMTLAGGIVVSNSHLSIEDGNLLMIGSFNPDNYLSFLDNVFEDVTVVFDGSSQWKVRGKVTIQRIEFGSGNVDFENQNIHVSEFFVEPDFEGRIDIRGAKIEGLEDVRIPVGVAVLTSDGTIFEMSKNGIFESSGMSMLGELRTLRGSEVALLGGSVLERLTLSGRLTVLDNHSISNLKMSAGSTLILAPGTTQVLADLTILSTETERAAIKSTNTSTAFLRFPNYDKVCFDFLDVESVSVTGEALVNAGVNSIVSNSEGWLTQSCEDILFPNFSPRALCAGALTVFEDLSQGVISSWKWDFGNSTNPFTVTDEPEGRHTFSSPGVYQVTLTVSNASKSSSYTKAVNITANPLESNSIIFSNGRLSSVKPAETYQWFRDGIEIPGEVGRSFEYSGVPGVYFVVTQSEVCNRISAPFVVLSTREGELRGESISISIFPNPVKDQLVIHADLLLQIPLRVRLIDLMGRSVLVELVRSRELVLDTSLLSEGMYLVEVASEVEVVHQQRVLVKK